MELIFIAGANSIHSLRWIKFFINKKHTNIHWISINKPNHETEREFDEIKNKLEIYFLSEPKYFFSIIKLLSSKRISILHIHYIGWHSLLALFSSKYKKLILTPWGSDIFRIKNRLKNIWIKYLIKKSQFILCDSERLKEKVIKLGINKKKVKIIMFGVDTNIYRKSRTIFSKELIYIGSNRKFETIYDLKTFLLAAKNLCKKSNIFYFIVAGDGSQKKELLNFVSKNNLKSKIKFVGLLNKNEMIKFYNSIDIYVSTSLSDGGLSSSIAEAMSFERLVMVTNNSDNKKWIKNEKNGFLFENRNVDQLVDLILTKIKDKKNIIKIAESARDLITKKYSYNKEMLEVEKIYKDLSSK